MAPSTMLFIIIAYFLLLISISILTGKEESNAAFFSANKTAPWYIVAFGMIGASLSGVTFISVPGLIGTEQFAYFQGVLGFLVGYIFIAIVLLPIYYKLNVTSIYEYLEYRFGVVSYKTGAFFFLLSRVTGASFRLFLVALALQYIVFNSYDIPFWVTVIISILLIWVYTFRGGIKTIIWTDTLQTLTMLAAVILAITLILQKLEFSFTELLSAKEYALKSKIFFFKDSNAATYFWKYFIGGIFIAIAMTGLDQDMMQKNLTCRNHKESQKNMISMAVLLVIVNFAFLSLGALLFIYSEKFGVQIPIVEGKVRTDLLFPEIAMNQNFGKPLAIIFIIGLIAAAYSSADSALTSLTTSFSVDFLNIKQQALEKQKPLRKKVHIGVSVVIAVVVILFNYLDGNVVSNLFTFATFTYGPLLGLFAFGVLTNRVIKDKYAWLVGLLAIIITYGISILPQSVIGAYQFKWEILPINGFIAFMGLYLISKKKKLS